MVVILLRYETDILPRINSTWIRYILQVISPEEIYLKVINWILLREQLLSCLLTFTIWIKSVKLQINLSHSQNDSLAKHIFSVLMEIPDMLLCLRSVCSVTEFKHSVTSFWTWENIINLLLNLLIILKSHLHVWDN